MAVVHIITDIIAVVVDVVTAGEHAAGMLWSASAGRRRCFNVAGDAALLLSIAGDVVGVKIVENPVHRVVVTAGFFCICLLCDRLLLAVD